MVFRGLLTQVAARGRGEHQVLGILTFALLFDGFHYLLWNGNVPYLPCFRSSLKMFSARTHPTQAHLKPVVLDVHMLDEYLTRWGPGLLRLGAIMSFGGYCVSRPGLLRLGAVVG